MLRGDAAAALRAAETVVELGRKLELPVLAVQGAVCSAWARARLAYYGKWLSRSSRGEMGLARQIAERFLCEAKVEDRMVEAAVASRNLGLTCFWQGDFTEANAYLEEALRLCGAQHDSQVNGSRTSVGRAHVSVIVKPAARDFERASRQLRRRESSIGFHSFRDCSPRSKPKGKA